MEKIELTEENKHQLEEIIRQNQKNHVKGTKGMWLMLVQCKKCGTIFQANCNGEGEFKETCPNGCMEAEP